MAKDEFDDASLYARQSCELTWFRLPAAESPAPVCRGGFPWPIRASADRGPCRGDGR